ncbi:MAG TPA: Holliday junction branch migration protein RuvA [Patescibacteria group bacterium]|nr:Holliday junction branch migration protein RuvA [Patescibacteria group bacterium]
MIGFLSGLVKSLRGQQATVVVNGVGYTVSLPASQTPTLGKNIDLFIHTHVREDTLALYGFKDAAALDLFENLISVSGVGPKSALAIVSVASTEVIKKAIETSNLNFFTAVSGIGKKSAQKIIIDLKPKLTHLDADLASLDGNSELNQALSQLGFSKSEIVSVLPQVAAGDELQNQIKQALKLLR